MLPRETIELSDHYAPALVPPPPVRRGVCARCRSLIAPGYRHCYRCSRQPSHIDVIVPVALSVARGAWHKALRGYKDAATAPTRGELTAGLAAVLARFLHDHELCITERLNCAAFDLVTIVPSKRRDRDTVRTITQRCPQTSSRYFPLLEPHRPPPRSHLYDPRTYRAEPEAADASILLIDDTWATGATAQSAAAALRKAGATTVALVVLGRHVNPARLEQANALDALPPFRWDRCVLDQAAAPRSSSSHASTSLR